MRSEEEEEEEEAEGSDSDDSDGGWRKELLRKRVRQYAAALAGNGVPRDLAARLLAGVRTASAEVSDDGNGSVRTLALTTSLALDRAAAPGLELRLCVHNRMRAYSVEFTAQLHRRPTPPLPAGHPARRGG